MKWSRFFVFGVVLILGVIAAGVFYGIRSIPPISEQIPASPVIVQLVAPLNGTIFEGGASVGIQAQAVSPNNITQIEIWADGQLLDSQAVSGQFPEAVFSNYTWPSAKSGVHVLMARAVDAAGFTGQSSLALVTIKMSSPMTEYTASEGDSLAGIADFLGIDPQAVSDENPEMDPTSGLPEGTQIKLPVPEPAPPTPPIEPPQYQGTAQEPAPAPNPLIYKISQIANLWTPPAPLPVPPLLYGSLENCNQVKLTVVPQSDNEDGYFVYRYVFNPQAPLAFENIAVLGLGGASMQPLVYTEPFPGLAAFYYVSAFNMTGEVSSAPISLMYDLDCLSGANSDPLQVELLGNFEAGVPVSRAYCYYATMEGIWQRFPSQDFDFFTPGDVFLEPLMLSNFPPNPILQMECWGWDGPTLQFLGSGEAMVSADPVTLVGTNFAFDLPPLKMLGVGPGGPGGDQAAVNDAFLSLAGKQVPPPLNVREAENGYVCAEHFQGMYPGQCEELIHKPLKQEYVLIWDWENKTCWPGTDCPWLTDENGMYFKLYMESEYQYQTITTVYDLGVVTPLPWGYACYYVTAVVDTAFGPVESAPSNTYCPGEKDPPQEMVLTPTDYLTLGKQSLYQCLTPPSNPASSLPANQVMVGVIDTACWDFRYQGAVMFDLEQLDTILGGYSLQSATLRFTKGATFYQNDSPGYEKATNEKPLCGVDFAWITGFGYWTEYDPTSALNGGYPLLNFLSNSEIPIPTFNQGKFEVDVTHFVQYYGGGANGGFGFNTNVSRLYAQKLFEGGIVNRICWNRLQDFELVIRYYPLGQ